jgi:hypothetical protein
MIERSVGGEDRRSSSDVRSAMMSGQNSLVSDHFVIGKRAVSVHPSAHRTCSRERMRNRVDHRTAELTK